ncbi:molybdopterin-dependent oxidoreductase [Profundibacterium mesophilum]|uniref:Oxidoreductase molybdopterin binding domain containing protein n=1 Tax=Profundibacterium mesophilum KAUST100406-0324 TaxID=1037889 RepID=A0A921NPW8_9RHOB|nr:molybdopterin-dependent oxidoreductase [Profundibacterium mesophilum]KAF0675050.1 Oxidoreductase molybdopterin binding domain containing protein [Profundibacterium mesophilum KAUST100406-0324]
MKRFLAIAAMTCSLGAPIGAAAQTVLSVVDGEEVIAEFDRDALSQLETIEVVTDNDYVSEVTRFTGPLLRDMFTDPPLDRDDELHLTALNDYTVVIPASDAIDYDVILATHIDGKPMSVRSKGPIWVIYPMSDHSELSEASYNDRLIWQLAKVTRK